MQCCQYVHNDIAYFRANLPSSLFLAFLKSTSSTKMCRGMSKLVYRMLMIMGEFRRNELAPLSRDNNVLPLQKPSWLRVIFLNRYGT